MRNVKSQYNHGYRFSRDEEKKQFNAAAFYCQVIENADGVPFQLIFGPRTGEGFYLNVGAGIAQLLGVPPEDFTEKLFRDMMEKVIPLSGDIPHDPEECRKKFIAGELKNYRADVLVSMPGGGKKWIRDTFLPLTDEETGRVIGAFGILYDISSQMQLSGNADKAGGKEEESERLKSAFLHNISHEIRTPLNAIVGFSALLGDKDGITEQQREYLDIIIRNSDHLLEVISNIIEISDIEANSVKIRKENVNPGRLLRKVYDQLSEKASNKGIFLSYNAPPEDDDTVIYTDIAKLTQVLRNLTGNAVRFTTEGKVEFGYVLKESTIEFYVRDTGPGIPMEHQGHIFSRFFQVESSPARMYGGIGLGLAISKAYVEMMGGKIWFTSQPGEGCEFRFTVPPEQGGGEMILRKPNRCDNIQI